ncbi:MAG: YbhB/YbcL family Raf kinase inhibitor-like protein [Patescibacteria group bacterium]
MKLSGTAFEEGDNIPSKYTCDGENINPPLAISSVPKGAKSLTLIMNDPDSPSGTWLHWSIWNIAPDTQKIDEHSVPSGATEGKTSFGNIGYGGPCPGSGEHRYFFKIYALDTTFDLPITTDEEKLLRVMGGHILEQTELMGKYERVAKTC